MTTKREMDLWDAAVSHVNSRFQQWEKHWQDYHDDCRTDFALYLVSRDAQGATIRGSNLTLSMPFTLVENVLAEFHQAMFDEAPFFKQKPVGPEDEDAAEAVTQYTAHQAEKNHLKTKGLMYLKNLLIGGLSWAYIPWTKDIEWKRRNVPVTKPVLEVQRDPMTMAPVVDQTGRPVILPKIDPITGQIVREPVVGIDGKPVTEKKFVKEVTFDCWELDPLFPWDVYADPSITDPYKVRSGGEGIIVKHWMTALQLRDMQRKGLYYNVDEVLLPKDDGKDEGQTTGHGELSDGDKTISDAFNEGYAHQTNAYLVKRYWGKFRLKTVINKKGEEVVAYDPSAEPVETLIDVCGSTCLRCIRNPTDEQLRPIIATNLHPMSKKLISKGLLRIVHDELVEYRTFRSMRLDNLKQKMNPMYQIGSGVSIPTRTFKYSPFGIIRVPNPGRDIAEVPTPDLGVTYGQDMDQINFQIQNATNALNAAQSTSTVGQAFGRTAAGINFFTDRFSKRMQKIVDVAEDQFFGGLSDIVNAYNQQFLKDEKSFQVINKPNVYLSIAPESYMQRRDFVPVGASRKLNKGAMTAILDRMLTNLAQFKDFSKVDVLLREFVKLTDLFPNPDRILYTPEELKQRQAESPPDIKKSMNLTVNFADLPMMAQSALLKEVMPQLPDQATQQTQPEINAKLLALQGGQNVPGGL